MSDISPELVSQYANQFDPSLEGRESEARRLAALVQGMLAGLASMDNGPVKMMTKLVSVEQDKGPDGIYYPWFHLVFESGIRLRVSIDPEV